MQDATTAHADTLAERYESTMDRVARAAERSGRRAEDILVVAVSKYAELDDIRELIERGHRDFGESRAAQLGQRAAMIGEWLDRRERFGDAAGGAAAAGPAGRDHVRWHMVGRLQRNKVKKLLTEARLIHSIDSMRLAEEIQGAALKREHEIDGLLQVNASGETTKAGVTLPAAVHVAEQIDTMTFLRLRGLMTMAPRVEQGQDARFVFDRARGAFEDIQRAGIAEGRFTILSMGMSGDFEAAIECGANCVRIGSAIFGPPVADDQNHG